MPYAQPLKTGDPAGLGEYEIIGRLGEGGQGVVYVGVRPDTGSEPYAVKLLHGSVGEDPEVFLREVELAKQVARFCTAQVIDAGLDGDRPYIVSEYVDGPSLHREVAVSGPYEGGRLERLAIGTATALAAIHRAGIVHRDFKPQNVLIGPDGPRVIDFGLARALDAAATQSGRGAGTPAYMAPEQVEGAEINPAADVFAWGATICFAANAQAPFGQDSIAAVLNRILTAAPQLGRLDGLLGALVVDCLDKNPRNRPSSRELMLALLGNDGHRSVLDSRTPPVPGGLALRADSGEPDVSGPSGVSGPSDSSGTAGSSGVSGLAGRSGTSGSARWARSGGRGSLTEGEDFDEPRTHPGRAATRASVAVSGALLVSAAVLVGVLVPALSGVAPGSAGAPPSAVPVVETSPQVETEPQASRTSPPVSPLPTTPAKPPRAEGVRSSPLPPPAATTVVPALVGLDRSGAARLIKQAGLATGTVRAVDSDRPVGEVLASSPVAGTTLPKKGRVALEVSAGFQVPKLVGLARSAARAALAQAGLVAGGVSTRCSDQPAGRVLASTPGAGSRVSPGSAVALVISRHGVPVPSITGQSAADASNTLGGAGFAVRTRARLVTNEAQDGVVLAQSVAPGTCARPGATVVITVGVGGQSGPGPGPSQGPGETIAPTDPSDPPDPVPGEAAPSG
ncbi:PASTA domain-containing protein [Streptosporangium sp. NBC_01755]|uniref:protein kinase domain-containing protein n=1 Tax=unclassified Streptosporangium TaxID=2632669 RepID=UPI002DD82BFD|nr:MULTISPECIES: PASTA domain-containing protein [unclassified Streptosporangium]WSA23568.1 PASTA domain-containing protein [Streptosporangium sp. NBC_01810]WSC98222.1 PASTA domain-containing protein [Streptosporangium sp. NBC_01755]